MVWGRSFGAVWFFFGGDEGDLGFVFGVKVALFGHDAEGNGEFPFVVPGFSESGNAGGHEVDF